MATEGEVNGAKVAALSSVRSVLDQIGILLAVATRMLLAEEAKIKDRNRGH